MPVTRENRRSVVGLNILIHLKRDGVLFVSLDEDELLANKEPVVEIVKRSLTGRALVGVDNVGFKTSRTVHCIFPPSFSFIR